VDALRLAKAAQGGEKGKSGCASDRIAESTFLQPLYSY
jgi:hypothetical protein